MSAIRNGITNTLTSAFRSLRVHNYRLYFGAQIVSQSGTWMQSVAQGWLVVHLTGSALLLALTVALQFGPVLVVGPIGGLAADRVDKRKLLIATQTAMTVLAAVLGVLTLTGVVRVWMILVLAALYGVTNGLDNPARQAFVTEMVCEDDVVNAVSLNSVIVNASRVVGPAIAGILIVTLGLAACFLANAASYLFVIAALMAMRSAELHRTRPLPREGGQMRAGFAYVRRTPELRVPLTIMVVVGTLGYNFSILLPLMAKIGSFHRGGGTYSVLLVAMGVGALAGGLYAASRRRPSRRLLVVATLGFGVLSVVGALMPTVAWEIAVLVPFGVLSVLFVTTTNSLLQLNSEPGHARPGDEPLGGRLSGRDTVRQPDHRRSGGRLRPMRRVCCRRRGDVPCGRLRLCGAAPAKLADRRPERTGRRWRRGSNGRRGSARAVAPTIPSPTRPSATSNPPGPTRAAGRRRRRRNGFASDFARRSLESASFRR